MAAVGTHGTDIKPECVVSSVYDPIKSEDTDDEDMYQATNRANVQQPINIKIKEEYKVKVKEGDDGSTDDERSPEYVISSSSGYHPIKSEETDDEDTDKSNSHENINIKEAAAKTEEDSNHYDDDTDQEDEVEVIKTEEDSDHAYDDDTDKEEEDTNNTSNEQLPIKVKPDDVSTDDEHGNEMKEAKKRRKMSLQEEEEEEKDDEGFRDMDMQGRKWIREKVKPPLKTEEVPTDNKDEEMADDKSSSGTSNDVW